MLKIHKYLHYQKILSNNLDNQCLLLRVFLAVSLQELLVIFPVKLF